MAPVALQRGKQEQLGSMRQHVRLLAAEITRPREKRSVSSAQRCQLPAESP